MATAASIMTTMKTGDQPEMTLDAVSGTKTEGVSREKLPASSTDKKGGDSGNTKLNAKVSADYDNTNINEEGDSVSDTQRKIRRAERFGMPVQLSEEEKRNSRAERFDTAPGSQGSDVTKKAEELKRKARAERFGISQSTTPTEEEEKKKDRLSRFGSSPSADPKEEEKKKARALRFSGTQENNCWQGNINLIYVSLLNRSSH